MLLFRLFPAALLGGLVLAALPVQADEAMPPRYNQVSLNAQANLEIEHDLMRVSLYSEVQGDVPAELAKITTARLHAATAKARAVKGIKLQTGNRTTAPVYDKDRKKILLWRERAELYLESKDMTALAALTGELLEDLNMGGRSFSISREKRQQYEDSLTRDAISAFRTRAQLVAESLGGKGWRLVQLSVSGNDDLRPYPMLRAMSIQAESNASADSQQLVEAGSSNFSIRADGLIEVLD